MAVIQNTFLLNNIYNLKKAQLNYKTKMFNDLTVSFFIGSFEYIKVWYIKKCIMEIFSIFNQNNAETSWFFLIPIDRLVFALNYTRVSKKYHYTSLNFWLCFALVSITLHYLIHFVYIKQLRNNCLVQTMCLTAPSGPLAGFYEIKWKWN